MQQPTEKPLKENYNRIMLILCSMLTNGNYQFYARLKCASLVIMDFAIVATVLLTVANPSLGAEGNTWWLRLACMVVIYGVYCGVLLMLVCISCCMKMPFVQ